MQLIKNSWQYRYLLYFLIWREVKVRYKQAIFGIAWAILTPMIQALVFWVVFGLIFKVPSKGIPYLPLVFTGITFWNYFSQGISSASLSLTGNSNLVTRVAFPKEILVLAAILARIPDLAASFLVLVLILFFYQINPFHYLLWVLLILIIESSLAFGIGLLFAATNVYFRDITALTPLVLMSWLFLTPVLYPLESIPNAFRVFVMLNPMTGILENLRKSLLLEKAPDFVSLLISTSITIIVLIGSYFVFKKLEKGFADVI